MIYAFDTYYFDDEAKTVCLGFENWLAQVPDFELVESIQEPGDYESGAFYKRELPCILSILDHINLQKGDILVVDGYVLLSDEGKLGLGGYLYRGIRRKIPRNVGVAKKAFKDNVLHVREVLRGESKNPLYITSLGIDVDTAANAVEAMHGAYRMPDLLRLLDQKTKE